MDKVQLIAMAVQAIASAVDDTNAIDDARAHLKSRAMWIEQCIAMHQDTIAACARIPQPPVLRYQLDKAIEAVVALRLATPMMANLSATALGWVDPSVKEEFLRFELLKLEQLEGQLRDARQRNDAAVSQHEAAAERRSEAQRELAARQHELAALRLALKLLPAVAPVIAELDI